MSDRVDPDRLRRLEELYHAACERPESQRQAWLEAACGGDAEMLGEVLSLCRQLSEGGLFERPAIDRAADLLQSAVPPSLRPGELVGPYRIEKRLGSGGMGDVFQARDSRLGRDVAIKTGRQEFSGRFQREARAIASLNHPNICTLYDIGPNYLVMELIEGQTLAERLQQGRLPMALARLYGSQIAGALAAAHARSIVHRDLKPANIMVTRSGIKVLDFGLARFEAPAVAGSVADTATGSGVIMGTPAYMAPEQIAGKPCDARTDIFALGLLLYEMAAGQRAFGGGSRGAVTDQILHADPSTLSGVSRDFARIVDRCLAKDPEDRWQSARDVQALLEFDEAPAAPPAGTSHRRLLPVWLGGGVGVAGLAAAVALWFQGTQAEAVLQPVTSYPGSEVTPSISPDGTRMAFAWNSDNQSIFDIYVKQIGPGDPIRLTRGTKSSVLSKWSPDGNWIAFLRWTGNEAAALYVIPAMGGMERKLVDDVYIDGDNFTGYWGIWFDTLDWSPDGKWLLIAKRSAADRPPSLVLASFESGDTRALGAAALTERPASGTFAPDGRALAFWKIGAGLMVVPLSAELQPRGPLREIPLGPRRPTARPAVCWSADGRELYYSVGARENSAIWRVAADGKSAPRPMAFLGEGATAPAVSRRGDEIIFSRYDREIDIWSLDLDGAGQAAGQAVRAFDSTKSEFSQEFSPDGTKVAFASGRSGNDEIWVCRSDGSNCAQLTSLAGPQVGSPAWSPDGNWIAYDVFRDGPAIEMIPASGGKARTVTAGLLPMWSNDGQWIYFWKLPLRETYRVRTSGGPLEKVLDVFGQVQESADGKWLYYSSNGSFGPGTLRRGPLGGGPSEDVLPDVSGRNYRVVEGGIWYLTAGNSEGSSLQYYDFASKASRVVLRTNRPVYAGFSLSPDGRRVLFTQVDRPPSHDLVLVKNFR